MVTIPARVGNLSILGSTLTYIKRLIRVLKSALLDVVLPLTLTI
jgi:hypothetical protein